jgi:hypothetical protein
MLGRRVVAEEDLFLLVDSNPADADIAGPKEARERFYEGMVSVLVFVVVFPAEFSFSASSLAASKQSPGIAAPALDGGNGTESRVETSTTDLGIDGEFWVAGTKHEEFETPSCSPCDHARVGLVGFLLVVVVVVEGRARLSVASGRGSGVWAPAFLVLSASGLFRCAFGEETKKGTSRFSRRSSSVAGVSE